MKMYINKLFILIIVFILSINVAYGAYSWIDLTSANYEAHCGHTGGFTPQGALDGTGEWKHTVNEWHWVDMDLGDIYRIRFVASRSSTTDDPTNVNVYISHNTTDWGEPVVTGISNWQDTTVMTPHTVAYPTGRYVRYLAFSTEDLINNLGWGKTIGAISIARIYAEILDVIPPSFNTISINDTTPNPNDIIAIGVKATDEDSLSMIIFSWNATGTWETISNTSVLADPTLNYNYTVDMEVTAPINAVVGVRFSANDTENNWNQTDISTFTVQDNEVPLYSDFAKNITEGEIYFDSVIKFDITISDDNTIIYYNFSWNCTDGMVWQNITNTTTSTNPVYATATHTLSTELCHNFCAYMFCSSDSKGNVGCDNIRTFIVGNHTLNITNISPRNNSIDLSNTVTISFDIDEQANCSLYIDGSYNQSILAILGNNAYPPMYFDDGNYEFYLFCRDSVHTEVIKQTGTYSFITKTPREDEFILGVCPVDTIARATLFMFFIILAFIILGMGYMLKNGLIGSLGSILLIGLGVYTWFCLAFVSLIIMMLGLVFITFFVFKGVSGFK